MRYWKEGLVLGACAVACAAPFVLGSAAAGLGVAGLGFLGLGEIAMAVALALAGAGFFLWRRRRANPTGPDSACGCGPTSGCGAGNACDVPAPTIAHGTPADSPKKLYTLTKDRISA
jgi:hypothetical protein